MCTYKKMQTMLNSTQKITRSSCIYSSTSKWLWMMTWQLRLTCFYYVCMFNPLMLFGHFWPEDLNFFKSLLHRNGTKLGDFYGIWNVNTHKNWGLDSSRLSGRKKNSHTCALRSKMTDHRKLMGNRRKLFCLQSTNRPQYWKKAHSSKGMTL